MEVETVVILLMAKMPLTTPAVAEEVRLMCRLRTGVDTVVRVS